MPGWLTLVIDMGPAADRRSKLRQSLTRDGGLVNETTLLENGAEVGWLLAMSKEAQGPAKEATATFEGRVRAVRVDAETIATGPTTIVMVDRRAMKVGRQEDEGGSPWPFHWE